MRIYRYDVGVRCKKCKHDIVDHDTGLCRWHFAEKHDLQKCDACKGDGSFCRLDGGELVTYPEAFRAYNTTGEAHAVVNCERCDGFGFIVPRPAAPSRGDVPALF